MRQPLCHPSATADPMPMTHAPPARPTRSPLVGLDRAVDGDRPKVGPLTPGESGLAAGAVALDKQGIMRPDAFAERPDRSGPVGRRLRLLRQADDTVVTVALASLVPGDSPRRSGIEEAHACMLAGIPASQIPPILIHKITNQVIDGMHRQQAAVRRGEDSIQARFVDCNDDDAFLLAIEMNTRHGLPLSLADRESAARRIIACHADWSDRRIAVIVGMAGKTVAALRECPTAHASQLEGRIGRDGRFRPVDAAEGRLRSAEFISAYPSSTLREIAAHAGVSLGTARDVRERLRRGEDALPSRQRAGGARRSNYYKQTSPDRTPDDCGANGEIDMATWPSIRERLTKDPTLKYTESGRAFIRWMDIHMTCLDEDLKLIGPIPARWSKVISALAYSRGEDWCRLARQIENQEGSGILAILAFEAIDLQS